jgi:hypothetical protein
MAVGIRINGVDLDDLFTLEDLDGPATDVGVPNNNVKDAAPCGIRLSGQDISLRFANKENPYSRTVNPPGQSTGIRFDGTEIRDYFAHQIKAYGELYQQANYGTFEADFVTYPGTGNNELYTIPSDIRNVYTRIETRVIAGGGAGGRGGNGGDGNVVNGGAGGGGAGGGGSGGRRNDDYVYNGGVPINFDYLRTIYGAGGSPNGGGGGTSYLQFLNNSLGVEQELAANGGGGGSNGGNGADAGAPKCGQEGGGSGGSRGGGGSPGGTAGTNGGRGDHVCEDGTGGSAGIEGAGIPIDYLPFEGEPIVYGITYGRLEVSDGGRGGRGGRGGSNLGGSGSSGFNGNRGGTGWSAFKINSYA